MTAPAAAYEGPSGAQAIDVDKGVVSLVPSAPKQDYGPVIKVLHGARDRHKNQSESLPASLDAEKERLNRERRGVYTAAGEKFAQARERYEKERRKGDDKYTGELDEILKRLVYPVESSEKDELKNLFPEAIYAKLETAVRDTEAGTAGASYAFVDAVLALARDAHSTQESLTRTVQSYLASEIRAQKKRTEQAFNDLDALRKNADKPARGPLKKLRKDLEAIVGTRVEEEADVAEENANSTPFERYGEMGVGHAKIAFDTYLAATGLKLKDCLTNDTAKEGLELGVLTRDGKDVVLELSFFEEEYRRTLVAQ